MFLLTGFGALIFVVYNTIMILGNNGHGLSITYILLGLILMVISFGIPSVVAAALTKN